MPTSVIRERLRKLRDLNWVPGKLLVDGPDVIVEPAGAGAVPVDWDEVDRAAGASLEEVGQPLTAARNARPGECCAGLVGELDVVGMVFFSEAQTALGVGGGEDLGDDGDGTD
ncbi:hypothetical protein FRC07_002114, partial [Ceratobasidium sp. 392]